jgi:hypothetical protein
MNTELFEPRGLFAMVMTFKPEEQSKSVYVDTSSASATVVQGLRTNRTRDVSNTTYGELQLPPSAPLVFPNFDDLSARSQDNNLKKSGHFMADYFDRRAQAQYVWTLLYCLVSRNQILTGPLQSQKIPTQPLAGQHLNSILGSVIQIIPLIVEVLFRSFLVEPFNAPAKTKTIAKAGADARAIAAVTAVTMIKGVEKVRKAKAQA